jgi:hypothetical protein
MRTLLTLAIVVALLAPGTITAAQSGKSRCQRLTRQMEQFEGTLALAKQRDDDMWADATKAHIAHLGARRARLCPEYRPPNRVAQWMRTFSELSRLAAKAAIKYFTGQWF